MSRNDNRDDDGRELITCPVWGGNADVSPVVEEHLEWMHSRVYSAWHNDADDRVARLSEDTLKDIVIARMDVHQILSKEDHVAIRAIEREIRRIERGDGPEGADDTTELDVAWVEILAEALGVDGFDSSSVEENSSSVEDDSSKVTSSVEDDSSDADDDSDGGA